MDNQEIDPTNARFDYHTGLKKPSHGLTRHILSVDLWINRPLAGLLVRSIYNSRMAPNHLTLISLCLGLCAAALFMVGSRGTIMTGAILLQLSAIFDGADGMLARSKGVGTRYGAYLDLFCDRIIDFATITGLAIGAFHFGHPVSVLLLGLLAAGLYTLQLCLHYLIKAYLKHPNTGESGEARALATWVIVIGALTLQLNWLIYAILITTALMIIDKIVRFVRLRDASGGE